MTGPAGGRRASHGGVFAAIELGLVLLVVAAGVAGEVWLSTTPWLLAVGWLSLRWRGRGWRAVGFDRPRRPLAAVGGGLLFGLAYQALSLRVLEPVLARWTGEVPDLEPFAAIEGDPIFLAGSLVLAWTLAAVGEELVYRGYLQNRLAELLGGGRGAWAASLVVASALFGVGHAYQGWSGVIAVGSSGFALGGLYLLSGRNLLAPMVAHGTIDTVAFLLIYLGRYPPPA